MSTTIATQLTERFYRYLSVTSQSDASATTLPSTPGQHDMARLLAEELHQLGLENIQIDEHATVTAVKSGTKKAARASVSSRILIRWMSACARIFIRKRCVSPVRCVPQQGTGYLAAPC